MKKRLLIVLLLLSNNIFSYNTGDLITFLSSLSGSKPGCVGCDLTDLDFTKTLSDLNATNSSCFAFGPTTPLVAAMNGATAAINLTNAKLSDSSMPNFKGKGLNLTNATAVGLNLSNAKIINANFSGANLSHANFENANLVGASFDGATLSKELSSKWYFVSFAHANLSNAILSNVQAEKMDFSSMKTHLYNTSFANANLQGSSFNGISMAKANFTGANVKGVDFRGSYLGCAWSTHSNPGINFYKAQGGCYGLACTDFTGVDLNSCNFQGSSMESVSFEGANIEGLFMPDATLSNAIFKDAIFDVNTNFTQSNLGCVQNVDSSMITAFIQEGYRWSYGDWARGCPGAKATGLYCTDYSHIYWHSADGDYDYHKYCRI